MILALGGGVLDQIGVGQEPRVDQDWLGNRDRVVEGERADQLRRRVVDMGEAPGQSRPRLDFDVGAKFPQHVVEQVDLLAGIATGAGGKQIGDAFENAAALAVTAGRERGVQVVDQRLIIFAAGIGNCGGGVGHGTQPSR
jgi:hypothetical protein